MQLLIGFGVISDVRAGTAKTSTVSRLT